MQADSTRLGNACCTPQKAFALEGAPRLRLQLQ